MVYLFYSSCDYAEYLCNAYEDPQKLLDAVTTNWKAMSTVSGIASGFAYTVIATDKHFNSVVAADIFGVLVTSSFIMTLFGCLLAQLLAGIVEAMGPSRTEQFLRDNCNIIRIPVPATVFGMLLFTLSCLVLIWKDFTDGVFYFAVVMWTVFIGFAMVLYARVQMYLGDHLDDYNPIEKGVRSQADPLLPQQNGSGL